MTCCGSTTRRPVTATATKASSGGPVLFEYDGKAPLTFFGRKTGIRYYFPGPGARVYVDGRDRDVFEIMSGMRVVTPAP
ncbi:MAG: hypothetical protein WDO56_09130 [Gammaproteobacteria bacterium]